MSGRVCIAKKLIQAVRKDADLLAEIANAKPGKGVCVWWLGQSGFLVKSAVGTVLFDPYLSDSLTVKYEKTDKPHVRMTERCVDPAQLADIDIVTSSHNHTDHLDAETLKPLIDANPGVAMVIPSANRDFVADRIGCERSWPLGLVAGQAVHTCGIKVHAVPAAHNELATDEMGRHLYLGYVVQLGAVSIYHSGDTLRYDGMAEALKRFKIDLALLPINGNRPERKVSGNLFGDEAARLAHEIGARTVVPCHYDMFTFNTEPPDLFVKTCETLGQPYKVMRCGEKLALAAAPSSR